LPYPRTICRRRPKSRNTARTHREPPKFIPPQLTLPVQKPPTGDEWGHELKFDGYRLHARILGNDVRLLTRTRLDWTDKYCDVASMIAELRMKSAYIDGELCALRPDGTSSFADLQAASDRKISLSLTYLGFDLLFMDGNDIRALPLRERKARLSIVLAKLPPRIQYVDHVVGHGCPRLRTMANNGTRPVCLPSNCRVPQADARWMQSPIC
jgi:bifunctional non-homologous end joining protein LigD